MTGNLTSGTIIALAIPTEGRVEVGYIKLDGNSLRVPFSLKNFRYPKLNSEREIEFTDVNRASHVYLPPQVGDQVVFILAPGERRGWKANFWTYQRMLDQIKHRANNGPVRLKNRPLEGMPG